MREVIDQSVSKRPIKVFDEGDIANLISKIEATQALADLLEQGVEWRKKSEQYQELVNDCHRRLVEIALKRMTVPVTDVNKHAEIVGQFNERLIFANQLTEDRQKLSYFRKWINAAWSRVDQLRLKTKKG